MFLVTIIPVFGLDTTDMTSTTTRSLDLSSLLDGRTDSDASTGDARAIRRQLRGLENMYAEVLQLLGVRKPANLPKPPTWEARLADFICIFFSIFYLMLF